MASSSKEEIKNSFDDFQQRSILKFLFVQGNSAASAHREIGETLQVAAYSKRAVEFWFKRFNEGNYDIKEHRGGDHVSDPEKNQRVALIEQALTESRCWSLVSLSAHTGIPKSTVHRIMTEALHMKKVNAKWVPHELTPALMEQRVLYSEANMKTYNQQKSRLQHTVTIDDTWISLLKPLEKDQAKQWKRSDEKLKQVAVADRHGKKYMMILALDINGICYYEILDQIETVNSQRYLTFLENLMDNWHGSKKHTV